MRKVQQGVTLIELMIVVAIIAILGAIGYPSYKDMVLESKRSEAMTELLRLADLQERYYLDNNTYGSLSDIGGTNASENNYYRLQVSNTSNSAYTLTATAINTQADDSHCAQLTLDHTGTKGGTNTDCWQ